jgi:hypothetical protein
MLRNIPDVGQLSTHDLFDKIAKGHAGTRAEPQFVRALKA